MNNIQNYGMSNYQLGFQSKNTGKKVVKQIFNNTQNKKAYIKPETKNMSLSSEDPICDSRDLAMDRWERTNGHPERELDDVSMYLPNGQYISKRTGKVCG